MGMMMNIDLDELLVSKLDMLMDVGYKKVIL